MKAFRTIAKLYLSLTFISTYLSASAQTTHNLIGKDAQSQELTYLSYTDKGDILPDFSFCGYKGGGVAFFKPKIVKTIVPLVGDNTQQIQNSLDSIGQLKPDKNGMRGTLLLTAGKYNIAQTIIIKYSGVNLIGEKNKARNTILIATTPKQYTLIKVGEAEKPKMDKNSKREISADYVPSGTKELLLNDASNFKVGDAIIVERPSTQEWISFIGMDKLEANWRDATELNNNEIANYEKLGKLSEDKKKYDSTVQWAPGSKNLNFERKITAIIGNKIIINIPLTNALQKEFGGGFVYKYKYTKRVQDVGISDLTATSLYNEKVVANDRFVGKYFADENHGWNAIQFVNAENSWVDNVEINHFSFGFDCGKDSRFITIQNCSVLDPVSLIEGGRRYSYLISGQQCFVYKCYARDGRHDFVMGASVAGPNAFVDNKAELCHANSEPHQRWATGTLFENCSLSGPEAGFSFSNRGRFGTGHGWAGAQMVLWNCKTPLAMIMKPPTGQNFAFGTKELKDQWSTEKIIQGRVDNMNKVANTNYKYIGIPDLGDGYIFSSGKNVLPGSLYFTQLKERLQ